MISLQSQSHSNTSADAFLSPLGYRTSPSTNPLHRRHNIKQIHINNRSSHAHTFPKDGQMYATRVLGTREYQEWKDDILLKNKFLSNVFDFEAITESGEIVRDITYKANLQIKQLVAETTEQRKILHTHTHTRTNSYSELEAEKILNGLEELNRADTITYNLVINAVAKSSMPDSGLRAEKILDRMDAFYHKQMDRVKEWNSCVGKAEERYLLQKQLLEECGIFDMGKLEECGIFDMGKRSGIVPTITVKPNVRTYSSVIDAYSRSSSSDLEGAESAQSLLERLRNLYESTGDEELKPNVISYNSVINAWAKTGTVYGAETAVKLLDTMEKEGIADAISYNACIHAWARCGSKESGDMAETILKRMKEQATRAKSSDYDEDYFHTNIRQSYVEPNIRTYSSVIDAWSRSNCPTAASRAQAILDEMEKIYEETGDKTIQPNTVTYSTVINAHARSRDMDNKAAAALQILNNMKKLCSSGVNDQAKPTIVTYNSVLNACATTYGVRSSQRRTSKRSSQDEQDKTGKSASQSLALGIVKDLYKELTRKSDIRPDHFTYGTVLKACANLMSPGDDDAIPFIREVFDQCCADGQVSFGVCFQLRQAVPVDIYRELIPADSIDESNGHFIIEKMPHQWRKNVKEKRHYTKRKL